MNSSIASEWIYISLQKIGDYNKIKIVIM